MELDIFSKDEIEEDIGDVINEDLDTFFHVKKNLS